ncbi:hypothetical protein ACQPZZ_01895 [Microbispora sp. CA-135349]|uniref:hypothetical protein n=1 Tax=Microbispora sp. CA-135349 TaxID=3239953 RepID=UPI003D8C0CD1
MVQGWIFLHEPVTVLLCCLPAEDVCRAGESTCRSLVGALSYGETARVTLRKSSRWHRALSAVALLGWLLLVAACYLRLPLGRALSLWYWLLIMALLAWSAWWTFLAVMAYLSRRAYLRATVPLFMGVIVAAALAIPNWENAFIDSLFLLQRDRFDAIGAAYRQGEPLPVPWWTGLLSIDGSVQVQEDGVYLPVYEDWRAETGAGIAYVPFPPDYETVFMTAAGDLGRPVRPFGHGWWWVE